MNPCLQCVASEEIRFGHLPCSARGDGKNSSDWLRGRHVSVCCCFYYSLIGLLASHARANFSVRNQDSPLTNLSKARAQDSAVAHCTIKRADRLILPALRP